MGRKLLNGKWPVPRGTDGQLLLRAQQLIPILLKELDLREPGQWSKGCTLHHWPSPCMVIPWGCCLLVVSPSTLGQGKNSQLLLFLPISEKFTFSASFTGTACGINSYTDYCKISAVYFSSVWILPLCAVLLKRNINMLSIILMTVSVPVQDDLDRFTAAHDLIHTQLNWWDLQLEQQIISMYIFIWIVPILLLNG